MSMYRYPIATALFSVMSLSFAQSVGTPGPAGSASGTGGDKFAEHKQMEIAKVQERMQVMQTLLSCVQGANDTAALKACNQTAKQAMQNMQHKR